MTPVYVALAVTLALLCLAVAGWASARREAVIVKQEHGRLWDFIERMRAVTIEPKKETHIPVVVTKTENGLGVAPGEPEEDGPRRTPRRVTYYPVEEE